MLIVALTIFLLAAPPSAADTWSTPSAEFGEPGLGLLAGGVEAADRAAGAFHHHMCYAKIP